VSYSTNNAKDNIRRDFLVVLSPRRRLTSWTLDSGSVYRTTFTTGYVSGVAVTGTDLTAGSSATLSAGQYYYDESAQILYIRKSDSTAPAGADWIVATFEIYIATHETYWYRTPTDSATTQVLFRGVINSLPSVRRSSSDMIFGFAATQSTVIGCANDPAYFQEFMHDSSFNKASAVIYHVAGDLKTTNVTKLFTGLTNDPDFDDKSISFQILEKSLSFDKQMANGGNTLVIAGTGTTDGTGADPSFVGKTIRTIYGPGWQGIRGICLDFKQDSPTTSVNRQWGFASSQWGTPWFVCTVASVTTTSIFTVSTTNAKKLKAYATLFVKTTLVSVDSIDTTTGVINITPGVSLLGAGDTVRGFGFSNLLLVQGENYYALQYSRDYSETDFGNGIVGITLKTSAEANNGTTTIDPATDYVVGNVNGAVISPTASGSAFYSGDWPQANPVAILYHILKDRLGLAESEIDIATFQTLAASITTSPTVSIPLTADEEMPTYEDVITRLLSTILCRAYIDANGKFTLAQIGVLPGSPDATYTDDDIDPASLKFSYVYGDLAEIYWYNGPVEFYACKDKTSTLAGGSAGKIRFKENQFQGNGNYNYQGHQYVHKGTLTKSIDSYSVISATYSKRLAEIVGERRGKLTVRVRSGAHSLDIGDCVQITRLKLPGYSYDGTTQNSRSFVITEIEKELTGVTLVLEDQKGIQDNTGDW
jgi:hypothetical protein